LLVAEKPAVRLYVHDPNTQLDGSVRAIDNTCRAGLSAMVRGDNTLDGQFLEESGFFLHVDFLEHYEAFREVLDQPL
jgi:hypothetical protein